MKNIEYTKMACVYDKFYQKKNYVKEVEFIKSVLGVSACKILDAGCGTGTHAKLLADSGLNVWGFDASPDMVSVANSKVEGRFFEGNLLSFNSDEKFDAIISFFAVFNHLKSYKEFKQALKNLKRCLNKNGKIIIDLHNPIKSGSKTEEVDGLKRIMQWRVVRWLGKEFSKITYFVGGKKYTTRHTFSIFKIEKIKKIAEVLGFSSVEFFENYNSELVANSNSKNIQVVLKA